LLALLLFGCDYGERNQDPIAQDETAITAREVSVTIDVLANDSDPDGDPVTLVAWTQGDHGEVIRGGDRRVTYTPAKGFDGSDRFTYTVDDAHGGQATGTVTVTVLPHPGVVTGGTLYTIQDVSPPGVSQAAAWGLNDAGQLAASGVVQGDDIERPLFIDADGRLTGIFVPGILGRALGINTHGLVTGFFVLETHAGEAEASERAAPSLRAVAPAPWPGRATAVLAHQGEAADGPPDDPPADGETDEDEHAEDPHEAEGPLAQSFLWDAHARSLIAIIEAPDAIATFAVKSNDAGVIVGEVQVATATEEDAGEHAHVHDEPSASLGFIRAVDGTFSTVGVPGASHTFFSGINTQGQIAGGFIPETAEQGPPVGFLRHPDGTLTTFHVLDDTGTPLGTRAEDVNDAGVIVGHFMPEPHEKEGDHEHGHEEAEGFLPFLRQADGTILRFTLPDAMQARLTDINNRGVISGVMIDGEGGLHAILLTPVPPAANTLFRDTPADGDGHDHAH
jgi:hypothetical protein